jgi:hypothetical protein
MGGEPADGAEGPESSRDQQAEIDRLRAEKALRIGAVALAALLFVFWGRPTALVVILIAVLLLAVLGLIELIGKPPVRPEMTAHP